MELTPAEYEALEGALRDAFVDYNDLGRAIRRGGFTIKDIVSPKAARPDYIAEVIDYAQARDSIFELISAVRQANPRNAALLKISASMGLEPGDPTRGASSDEAFERTVSRLERMVEGKRGISDLGSFAVRIQEVVRQVCAVELPGEAGTGFLIGPDTVLTNYHVVRSAIDRRPEAPDIVVRFDFRRMRDGRTVDAGKEYRLAEDWLVDFEPHSEVDNQPYDEARLPADDELDYAVLRLREPVGSQPVEFAPPGTQRGWLEPRRMGPDLTEDSFLMVVQHPCNDPISFDYANDAVVRLNPNKTRVHYRINTLPGSSGSPVLDHRLDLVALHHAGEPGSPDSWLPCNAQLTEAAYNEGIPIGRIVAQLAEKLGADSPFGTLEESRGESQTTQPTKVLEVDTTASQAVAVSDSRRASSPHYAGAAAANPRGDGAPPAHNLQAAANNTVGASMRDPAGVLSAASVNSTPTIASAKSERAKTMRLLAERRNALETLDTLRRLMDEALDRFGDVGFVEHTEPVPGNLRPEEYVEGVRGIAYDLDMALPEEMQQALPLLQKLIATVLVGQTVADAANDFEAVIELAKQAAWAYEAVGKDLGDEQGGVFVRVAPYWAMKAAHARHRQAVADETRRMSASHASGSQGEQTVPPSAGTTSSRG